MRSLVLLSFFLGLSSAFTASLVANVSIANLDEFTFRKTSATLINSGIYNGAFLVSAGVDAGKNGGSADIVYASAVTAIALPPSVYISYFSTNVAANSSDPFSGVKLDASKSVIGNTYLRIEEVDTDGKVVDSKNLGGTTLYTVEDSDLKTGGVSYITFKSVKGFLSDFTFQLTAIFTDVVGVLDAFGNPLLTPKSVETLIQIDGWDYDNEANSLRLIIGVGSLQGSASVDAQVTYTAGVNTDGVYALLSTSAQVDGKTGSVTVSALADASVSDFGNAALAAQIGLRYGGNASFKLVNVTFPAGAKSIIYDPTIGAGANPPESSASKTGAFFLVALLALLF